MSSKDTIEEDGENNNIDTITENIQRVETLPRIVWPYNKKRVPVAVRKVTEMI